MGLDVQSKRVTKKKWEMQEWTSFFQTFSTILEHYISMFQFIQFTSVKNARTQEKTSDVIDKAGISQKIKKQL